MDNRRLKVVVLIVCHNHRDDLGQCLTSVTESNDGPIDRRIIVVDNASSDGSADLVAENYGDVELIRSESNLGFSGGNNLGWLHVQNHHMGTDYLALVNPDAIVESGWIAPLAKHLDQHSEVGSVQPKLMLYPQINHFNSAGNRSHYLGFGFVTQFGQVDRGQFDVAKSIDFASGAAMMLRTDLLRKTSLFDEKMFMYLEDAELSWRLRSMGHDTVFVPDSVVYHKHQPEKTLGYYYHLERNRWWLLLKYYRIATLLVLAPALLVMEIGQLAFALRNRKILDKLRSYGFILHPTNLIRLKAARRRIQQGRNVGDRSLMTRFSGQIESPISWGWVFERVVNPLLGAYWSVVRRLIFW